jgi:hypothetical protein
MCVVSYVHDYYTNPLRLNTITWTQDSFDDLKRALEILERLDAKTEQPDCVDPAKARWMSEVEERLKRLEGQPV